MSPSVDPAWSYLRLKPSLRSASSWSARVCWSGLGWHFLLLLLLLSRDWSPRRRIVRWAYLGWMLRGPCAGDWLGLHCWIPRLPPHEQTDHSSALSPPSTQRGGCASCWSGFGRVGIFACEYRAGRPSFRRCSPSVLRAADGWWVAGIGARCEILPDARLGPRSWGWCVATLIDRLVDIVGLHPGFDIGGPDLLSTDKEETLKFPERTIIGASSVVLEKGGVGKSSSNCSSNSNCSSSCLKT